MKPPLVTPFRDLQRERLREAVARMETAIATGQSTPDRHELEAIAQLCIEHFLPVEAARVRRIAGEP